MSNKMPWIKMAATTAGLVGLGYGLMKAVVPTPEQTYQAMSPDLRKKVDANRAARLAQEQAVSHQVKAQNDEANSDKPLWANAQDSSQKR